MDNNSGYHRCNICEKNYKSYKSLWNHNYKFHSENSTKSKPKVSISKPESKPIVSLKSGYHENTKNTQSIYRCKYCYNEYKHKQSCFRHEKKCKSENLITIEKKDYEEIKNEINELKKKLVSITNNTTNNNSNNNNNNNITNNIINNKYVMFPNFEYKEVLTKEEIIDILNKNEEAIEESVLKIHFNEKFPEFQNIYISNLRDSKVHIFDGKQFIVANKNQALYDLIMAHHCELDRAYTKFGSKVPSHRRRAVKETLTFLNDEKEYTDDNGIRYSNYNEYKQKILNTLIYNKSDKKKLLKLKTMKLEEKVYEDILTEEEV